MVDDHFELGRSIAAVSKPRPAPDRTTLSWSIGIGEGVIAALAMFVPAVVYHVLLQHVSLVAMDFGLYAGVAIVAGLIHGTLAAFSAGHLLDRSRQQPALLAESAMGWTAAFAVALFIAFLLGVAGNLSRVSLISAYVFGLPVMLAVRGTAASSLMSRIRAGRLRYQKVAVVGAARDVERFIGLGQLDSAGFALCGTLYFEDARGAGNAIEPGAVANAVRRWVGIGVGDVVFVGELGDIAGLEQIVGELKRFAVNLLCAPATGNTSFKYLDVVRMGPNNALRFLKKPMRDGAVLAKRLFDLAGASLGLVLLSPLLLIVALLIKLDSPGPVFYRQERRGFNGESFYIWKFRSMCVTESGRAMVQAAANDPRITRVGRFIRSSSIDELPQLLNVLAGEMSLVGPRPHAILHDDELGHQIASYAHRQRIKPGITGWAQVNGFRGETRTLAQIEGRTTHDLYYVDNWSLFLDIWIIVLTIVSPRSRQNAG